MKVLVCGQKRFGRDVAELVLARGWKIAAVSCPVLGAADTSALDKLHILALNHGLPVIPAGRLDADAVDRVCGGTVDLIVAAHCHDYIGRKTRHRARLGALGYHPSLLPRHRGRSAIEWAIRFGEPFTGGSVYWLNDTVDGGPVAAQRHVAIRPGDTARELWARDLAPLGVDLFAEVFAALDRGERPAVPQDVTLATWEPAIDGVPALHRPDLDLLPAPVFSDPESPVSGPLNPVPIGGLNSQFSADHGSTAGFVRSSAAPASRPASPRFRGVPGISGFLR